MTANTLQIITDIAAYEGTHTTGWIVFSGVQLEDAHLLAETTIRIPIANDEGSWNQGLRDALTAAGYAIAGDIIQVGDVVTAEVVAIR